MSQLNPKYVSALAVAAVLSLSACEQKSEEVEQVLRPVRTLQVSAEQFGNMRIFSGVSQSQQEVQLSFRVSGTLIELPVQVGDRLTQGALIARLDPATYELAVEQNRASLAQAAASQRNARSAYERVKGLYENNNASKTDLDSARATAESTDAQVRAAEKAVELAELNLDYTRLTASADCAVAQTSVEVNENINAGAPVVSVDCGNEIKVDIAVPESLIAKMKSGQIASVRFNSVPDKAFRGVVNEVGVSATGAGSTFPVSISIDSDGSALRSGLAAEVAMEFSNADDISNVFLPVSAVNKNNSGEFVFIAVPTSEGQARVEQRNVQVGDLTERGVTILSGLSAGEYVVIAGTKVIRPDMTVLLK